VRACCSARDLLAYDQSIATTSGGGNNGSSWLLCNAEQLSATVRGCDEALRYTLLPRMGGVR
jgi:hypothetical protein